MHNLSHCPVILTALSYLLSRQSDDLDEPWKRPIVLEACGAVLFAEAGDVLPLKRLDLVFQEPGLIAVGGEVQFGALRGAGAESGPGDLVYRERLPVCRHLIDVSVRINIQLIASHRFPVI